MTCTIIAAIVNCIALSVQPSRSPADAVRVLTASVRPWQRPVEFDGLQRLLDSRPVPYEPGWRFTTPSTPAKPLASPWTVTTYYGRHGVETDFNGESLSRFALPVAGTARHAT